MSIAAADKFDPSVLVATPDGYAVDGSRAGVEVPWREPFGMPPYTIEVWARRNGAEPIGSLIGFAPPAIRQCWRLLVTDKGQVLGELAGCEPWQVYSDVRVSDDSWHHFALSFDGALIRIFLDGRCVGEKTTTYKGDPTSHGPLVIGTCVHPGSMQVSGALIRAAKLSSIAPTTFDAIARRDEATVGLWTFDARGVVGVGEIASVSAGASLDRLDALAFAAGPPPMVPPGRSVALEPGSWPRAARESVMLDGIWRLACDGEEASRLADPWADAIDAEVPGSIHAALRRANLIPDPTVGRNDAIAREMSHKTWWLRTTFARPASELTVLSFGGVADRCTVWLNGTRLGSHVGMFGGPDFDVGDRLRDRNELIVRVDAVPRGHAWYWNSNETWRDTVTVNCVYGWHYVELPCLGLWRSVVLSAPPKIVDPFVSTTDAHAGRIELRVGVTMPGRLLVTIEPANFDGPPHRFAIDSAGGGVVRASLTIPDPRPWWPNGLGEPNVYRLRLSLEVDGAIVESTDATFGLRTVEMRPLPDGPHPKRYDWTFVINGRPMFVKGAGWCTMDPLLDCRRERYARFLTLARQQNIQMLRAWGGGMPETDEFYDECDRLGIMVMQEWPTAWNSHAVQPAVALEETVRRNTLRVRNRASLVMWGAGNESSAPHGASIDMMGRLATELDGTRPFHRGEAWGGSEHNYDCWWGREPLAHNLTMTARFWGEFGVPSFPAEESVRRYLPAEERDLWPPPAGGSFAHHTPVFDRYHEMDRFRQYAGAFTAGATMRRFIDGTQLAQVVGVRHTLERARTRWPDCTGALMYKLNDVWPAGSWSTVDWYGATKLAHWFVRDAFRPLHGCALFDRTDVSDGPLSLPIYLLDDADALDGPWSVRVVAFDGALREIATKTFDGDGPIGRVRRVGAFDLSAEQASAVPLFVVVEVVGGERTFYFVNYEARQESLFETPRTMLSLRVDGDAATVTNVGEVPAACVTVGCPGHLDTLDASDGGLWLAPGESRAIRVVAAGAITVEAWNADAVGAER